MKEKTGFQLIHRADLLRIVDGFVAAARLAGNDNAAAWLLALRKAFE